MFELGDYAEKGHRQVGEFIKDKADILISIGKDARYIHDEANKFIESIYFEDKIDAEKYIKSIIRNGDVLLFKASRGMKLETIIDYIIKDVERGN